MALRIYLLGLEQNTSKVLNGIFPSCNEITLGDIRLEAETHILCSVYFYGRFVAYLKKITKLYNSNGLLKQDITKRTVYFVENNTSLCDRNDKGQIQVPKIIYWIRLKLID